MTTKQHVDPRDIDGGDNSSQKKDLLQLDEEVSLAGGEWILPEEFKDSIGRTMYDFSTSKDGTLTVLLPSDNISAVPSQSLVRIKSRPQNIGGDGRQYLAAIRLVPRMDPRQLRQDTGVRLRQCFAGDFLSLPTIAMARR